MGWKWCRSSFGPSSTRPCTWSGRTIWALARSQRFGECWDRASGCKPKTVATQVGKFTFDIPQVRTSSFYPQALDKGLRSERALKLALAEMYVQGVRTRKVAAITMQLCGFGVSFAQVS